MNPILGTIGAGALQAGLAGPAMYEQLRTAKNPSPTSSGEAGQQLLDAAYARVKDLGADSSRNKIGVQFNEPSGDIGKDLAAMGSGPVFAGMQRMHPAGPDGRPASGSSPQASLITINPHSGREALAHEMGHHITDQTKVGHMVHNLRGNPRLSKALAGAAMGLPFLQSALQEGDDDLGTGIAISALMSSPTLINEALATKNGLAIMEASGMKATAGQRARLAGAFLSYAAAPILAGFAGNALGNVADDYTAVYNLGGDNKGELPM